MTALVLLSLAMPPFPRPGGAPRSVRAESRTGERTEAPGAPRLSAGELTFAAYVPDYRLHEFTPAKGARFTDVLFFSVQPGLDGAVVDEHGLLPRLKTVAPRPRPYRALLAVGGGARSRNFEAVATVPALRERFVAQLAALVRAHDLDGLDLDWEHLESPEALAAWEALVLELRAALGKSLLTVALSDVRLLTPAVVSAVDRVHLMAYDGPRHASLAQATALADGALRRGVPPGRLCLGVPLFATGGGARSPAPWREVIRRHRPGPSVDEIDGWRFGGVETTRAKVRWLQQRQLGGVFFWELTQDAPGEASLIQAVRDELRAAPPTLGR